MSRKQDMLRVDEAIRKLQACLRRAPRHMRPGIAKDLWRARRQVKRQREKEQAERCVTKGSMGPGSKFELDKKPLPVFVRDENGLHNQSTWMHAFDKFWTTTFMREEPYEQWLRAPAPERQAFTDEEWLDAVEPCRKSIKASGGIDGCENIMLLDWPLPLIRRACCLFDIRGRAEQPQRVSCEDPWAVGQITLVPKTAAKIPTVDAFRPVVLLPVLLKQYERMLLGRVTGKLNANRGDNTHGFRRGYSPEELHTILTNAMLRAKEFQKELWIANVDIKTAFDYASPEGTARGMGPCTLR